jgi:hypothetical protein
MSTSIAPEVKQSKRSDPLPMKDRRQVIKKLVLGAVAASVPTLALPSVACGQSLTTEEAEVIDKVLFILRFGSEHVHSLAGRTYTQRDCFITNVDTYKLCVESALAEVK